MTLEDPADFSEAEEFQYHTVSLTFLGAALPDEDDALGPVPTADDSAVTSGDFAPSFSPASSTSTDAGHVTTGTGDTSAEANCGINDARRIPSTAGDLKVGVTYRTAVLSVIVADADPVETPDVVRFDYPTDVPGASAAAGAPTSVYWGAGDE